MAKKKKLTLDIFKYNLDKFFFFLTFLGHNSIKVNYFQVVSL